MVFQCNFQETSTSKRTADNEDAPTNPAKKAKFTEKPKDDTSSAQPSTSGSPDVLKADIPIVNTDAARNKLKSFESTFDAEVFEKGENRKESEFSDISQLKRNCPDTEEVEVVESTSTLDSSEIQENNSDHEGPEDSSKQKANFLSQFSNQKSSPKSSTSQKKTSKKPTSKYTPLEKQFMEIKEKHKDVILFVECGYKYRFFGEDAEVVQ